MILKKTFLPASNTRNATPKAKHQIIKTKPETKGSWNLSKSINTKKKIKISKKILKQQTSTHIKY